MTYCGGSDGDDILNDDCFILISPTLHARQWQVNQILLYPYPYSLMSGWQCGGTPLHNAAHEGKVRIIDILSHKGADVNALNNVSRCIAMQFLLTDLGISMSIHRWACIKSDRCTDKGTYAILMSDICRRAARLLMKLRNDWLRRWYSSYQSTHGSRCSCGCASGCCQVGVILTACGRLRCSMISIRRVVLCYVLISLFSSIVLYCCLCSENVEEYDVKRNDETIYGVNSGPWIYVIFRGRHCNLSPKTF